MAENSWLAAFNYAKAVQQKNQDFVKWLTLNDPNKSAYKYAEQFLSQFGFGPELATRLQRYMEDHGVTDPQQLQLWITSQPEFKTRFPAIGLMQDGTGNVITPADYIAYENKFSELMKRSGLDFLYNAHEGRGKSLVTQLLVENVSPDELANRIEQGYMKVRNAPVQVREAMTKYFGVRGDQALAAYFLDPDATEDLLVRQAEMAGVAGTWAQAGLGAYSEMDTGNPDETMPKWLADKLVRNGITAEQSLQVMAQAASLSAVYDETLGEGQTHMGKGRARGSAGGIPVDETKPGTPGRDSTAPRLPTGTGPTFPGQNPTAPVGPRPGPAPADPTMVANDITAEMGVEAAAGISPEAMARIRKRLDERTAAMSGGGGAAAGEQGTGLGSAY